MYTGSRAGWMMIETISDMSCGFEKFSVSMSVNGPSTCYKMALHLDRDCNIVFSLFHHVVQESYALNLDKQVSASAPSVKKSNVRRKS